MNSSLLGAYLFYLAWCLGFHFMYVCVCGKRKGFFTSNEVISLGIRTAGSRITSSSSSSSLLCLLLSCVRRSNEMRITAGRSGHRLAVARCCVTSDYVRAKRRCSLRRVREWVSLCWAPPTYSTRGRTDRRAESTGSDVGLKKTQTSQRVYTDSRAECSSQCICL